MNLSSSNYVIIVNIGDNDFWILIYALGKNAL